MIKYSVGTAAAAAMLVHLLLLLKLLLLLLLAYVAAVADALSPWARLPLQLYHFQIDVKVLLLLLVPSSKVLHSDVPRDRRSGVEASETLRCRSAS